MVCWSLTSNQEEFGTHFGGFTEKNILLYKIEEKVQESQILFTTTHKNLAIGICQRNRFTSTRKLWSPIFKFSLKCYSTPCLKKAVIMGDSPANVPGTKIKFIFSVVAWL